MKICSICNKDWYPGCLRSFHKYPKDPELYQKWLNFTREARKQPDFVPTYSSTICMDHFKEKDLYIFELGLKRARRGSVPCQINNEREQKLKHLKKQIDKFGELHVAVDYLESLLDPEQQGIETISTDEQKPSQQTESTKSKKNAVLEYDPDDELIIVDISENITNETVYIRDNATYDNENQEKPLSSAEKAHSNDFQTDCNTDTIIKLEKELQKKTLREQKHTKMIQSLKQQNLRLKKQVSHLQKLLIEIRNPDNKKKS